MVKEDDVCKVFISYSWSNQEHQDWVRELSERLMANGVDVILDVWSLKEGQDKYSFMESMVKDDEIRKVLIVCDHSYSAKADNRKGGVGTETQIISAELYDEVDQTKFIPLVVEKDAEGNPYVPVFLKARKYIDLSKPGNTEGFEILLRAIFDKPLHRKPTLGKPPSFLQEEKVQIITSGKYYLLIDAIERNKITVKGLLADFIEDACELIKGEYITSFKTGEHDEEILESISQMTPLRDQFCHIVELLCKYDRVELMEHFFGMFEELIPYMEFNAESGSFIRYQFDNIRFILRELFITMLAILIKNKNFGSVNDFMTKPYLYKTVRGEIKNVKFSILNRSIESLDKIRKQRLGLSQLSVMNDVLIERATFKGVGGKQICEVDFILWFNAVSDGEHWWPGSLIYLDRTPKLENFIRAESRVFFKKFKLVLNVQSKNDLIDKFKTIKRDEKLLGWRYPNAWKPLPLEPCLNLEKIDSI